MRALPLGRVFMAASCTEFTQLNFVAPANPSCTVFAMSAAAGEQQPTGMAAASKKKGTAPHWSS